MVALKNIPHHSVDYMFWDSVIGPNKRNRFSDTMASIFSEQLRSLRPFCVIMKTEFCSACN